MRILKYCMLIILMYLLGSTLPILAQDEPIREIPPNIIDLPLLFPSAEVSSTLSTGAPVQKYIFAASGNRDTEIFVKRIGGVFYPKITIETPNGDVLHTQSANDISGRQVSVNYALSSGWYVLSVLSEQDLTTDDNPFIVRVSSTNDSVFAFLDVPPPDQPVSVLLANEVVLTSLSNDTQYLVPLWIDDVLTVEGNLETVTLTDGNGNTIPTDGQASLNIDEDDFMWVSLSFNGLGDDEQITISHSRNDVIADDNAVKVLDMVTLTPTPIYTLTPSPTFTPTATLTPTLTITPSPTLTPTPVPYTEIAYGQTQSGRKSSNVTDTWMFTGDRGDVVVINLTSNNFDAYLRLYDGSNNLLAEDDDSGSGRNSAIRYELTTSGQHFIVVDSYSIDGSGGYQLSLEEETAITGQRITYGDMLAGRKSGSSTDTWMFTGDRGDVVVINLTSNNFDAYLRLYDGSNNLLAEDDDSGSGRNSAIRYELTTSGQYFIMVDSYSGGGSGAYQLSLEEETASSSSGQQQIAYGDTRSAQKPNGTTDRWVFDGNSGDVVEISLTSNSFDTYLRLFDGSNTLLREDDDGGSGTNSAIRYELATAGQHAIVVDAYSGSGSGQYQLSLVLIASSTSSASSSPSIPECPGASPTFFVPGDTAVVDFNQGGALRIITDPFSSRIVTIAQLYDNNRVNLLEGPVCANGSYYWKIYYGDTNAYGWIAEAQDGRPYLCPLSNPECR